MAFKKKTKKVDLTSVCGYFVCTECGRNEWVSYTDVIASQPYCNICKREMLLDSDEGEYTEYIPVV